MIIESFRPGVVDRLGIGYADISARNPTIVYCSTTGYGQDGPKTSWAGHDLNYLAAAGYLHCTERAEAGRPPLPGATIADSAGGGMHAVMAITAALVRRGRTGEGAYLDVAVADGVLALMALAVDEHLATGADPGPGHGVLTGRYACYSTYECGDGGWVAVAAIEPRFWANLCRLVGIEQWTDHQLDDAVQQKVRADLRAAFATRPRDDWVELLAAADTCVAAVLSIPEVVGDPQLSVRGAFVEAEHPDHGRFLQVAPVLAGTLATCGPLPAPGATQTDDLLRAAGISADECARLRAAGVVA